jgi:hypothetical protein
VTAELTGAEILATPMEGNDADASTIREYLVALLATLWDEGEGFSGKRPFGNSGWHWDLYEALVKAERMPGTFDENGYLEDVDTTKAAELIRRAIKALKTAEAAR